jgi:hypothetical protein
MNSATANPTGEYQALILGHLQKHRGAVQKSAFRWGCPFHLDFVLLFHDTLVLRRSRAANLFTSLLFCPRWGAPR